MMTSYYSCLLSLLYVLLITQWINAATLRSSTKWVLDRRPPPFIVDPEISTPEPVLFRRRPLLISRERQRRWTEDDEEEISIDNQSIAVSDETSLLNSTIVTVKPVLLRQDLDGLTVMASNEEIAENNNTDTKPSMESVFSSTLSNEIFDTNSTEFELSSANSTVVNEGISINQTMEETSTTFEGESSPIDQSKQDTAIILLDYTTAPSATDDANQTSIDLSTEIPSEYNTTMVDESVNSTIGLDETRNNTDGTDPVFEDSTFTSDAAQNNTEAIDNSTITLNIAQNDTETTDQGTNTSTAISDTIPSVTEVTDAGMGGTTIVLDATQNDTSASVYEDEEYSNETTSSTPTKPAKPICGQSCQCSKKCPYGFEIINETCQCDPLCKNYQCFGNDTCSVSKKGQPVCQPGKGFIHVRPFRCYQPRDAGYHNDEIQYYSRWYYNADQDECHLFVYRGLGGNENNFQTLHECRLECITCAPSPDRGSCLAFIPMWYYDHNKNQCAQFNYSGCKGNENKFLRKQECLDTCVTRIINL